MNNLVQVFSLEENAIDVIKKAGKKGITASDLLSKTRDLTCFDRDKLIQSLVNSGDVRVTKFRIDGSRKKSTVYFWTK